MGGFVWVASPAEGGVAVDEAGGDGQGIDSLQAEAVDYGYADLGRLAKARPDWIIGGIDELVALPAEPRSTNVEA